jgi:molecular chaperone DnaK
MMAEAEANADADKLRKETIEAKNEGDHIAYNTEKSLKEYEDKLEAEDKETIQKSIDELKSALEGEDVEEIKAKTAEVQQASQKIGEMVYKNKGDDNNNDGGEGGAAPPKDDENVMDADFKEKKEKKEE